MRERGATTVQLMLSTTGFYRKTLESRLLCCHVLSWNTPDGPLCENMTSSTKPEVHKVSQQQYATGKEPSLGHTQHAQKIW